MGQSLIEAKASVAHGEFGRLFSDHRPRAEGALPFRSNWANRLMKMADHQTIISPHHGADLPADLNTVYELAQLPADQLEAAIESGDVTPATTREEAKALRKGEPRVKVEREPEPPPDDAHDGRPAPHQVFQSMARWCGDYLADNRDQHRVVAELAEALLRMVEESWGHRWGFSDRRAFAATRLIGSVDAGLLDQVRAGTVNLFDAARKAIDMAEGALVARPRS